MYTLYTKQRILQYGAISESVALWDLHQPHLKEELEEEEREEEEEEENLEGGGLKKMR